MIYLFLNFLGTGELIFTVLIFILLFGADKIPSFSRNIGMFINKLKDASEDIKREINNSNLDIKSNIDEEIDQILKSKKKKKINKS
jgi:Sec-independent protein translocase protein TatA